MKIHGFNMQFVLFLKDVDLTRKLSESYDMQERLVADNADLEFKRSFFLLLYFLFCFLRLPV